MLSFARLVQKYSTNPTRSVREDAYQSSMHPTTVELPDYGLFGTCGYNEKSGIVMINRLPESLERSAEMTMQGPLQKLLDCNYVHYGLYLQLCAYALVREGKYVTELKLLNSAPETPQFIDYKPRLDLAQNLLDHHAQYPAYNAKDELARVADLVDAGTVALAHALQAAAAAKTHPAPAPESVRSVQRQQVHRLQKGAGKTAAKPDATQQRLF